MNQSLQPQSSGASGLPLRPGPRVAVIASSWHGDIVACGTEAIQAELERNPVPPGHVSHFNVPGAFEIPLYAKRLAASGKYDAIIACALVVNGGIYRHEFVASVVVDGLMRVQMESGTPVLSAVLTPRDFHAHEDHRRFFRDHFMKKGTEVARACLETIAGLEALEHQAPWSAGALNTATHDEI